MCITDVAAWGSPYTATLYHGKLPLAIPQGGRRESPYTVRYEKPVW